MHWRNIPLLRRGDTMNQEKTVEIHLGSGLQASYLSGHEGDGVYAVGISQEPTEQSQATAGQQHTHQQGQNPHMADHRSGG